MRKFSALFVLILIFSSAQSPANETTIVIGGRAFPIIELPTDDFADLPPEEREAFLERRLADLHLIRQQIDALNLAEGQDLVKKVKRDRCCSKGFGGASYITGSLLVLGSIGTSAADAVPPWIGYVVAGVTVAQMFFMNRAAYFKDQAIQTQEELQKFWSDLMQDYIAKKKAHEQQQEIEVLRARLDGGDVVLLPDPRLVRHPRVEFARAATTQQNGDVVLDVERMQEVELADTNLLSPTTVLAREGRSRVANPRQAVAPQKSPSRKKRSVKVKVRRNKSRSRDKGQRKPQVAVVVEEEKGVQQHQVERGVIDLDDQEEVTEL